MKNKRIIDSYFNELGDYLESRMDSKNRTILNNHKKSEELLSRKQIKERLGIAYSTLDDYTKRGILTSYRIGHRVYYKWSEVLESAKKVNH